MGKSREGTRQTETGLGRKMGGGQNHAATVKPQSKALLKALP